MVLLAALTKNIGTKQYMQGHYNAATCFFLINGFSNKFVPFFSIEVFIREKRGRWATRMLISRSLFDHNERRNKAKN